MPGQLYRIRLAFESDAEQIAAAVRMGLAQTDPIDQRSQIEWAIVRLHDAWAFRCRQLVKWSAVGGSLTRSGVVLARATNLQSRESFIAAVRRHWTPNKVMGKQWEPKWYDPGEATRVCSLLGVQNSNEISMGLGASAFCDEVRIVRNAVVHSLGNTWGKYRTLKAPQPLLDPPHTYATAFSSTMRSRINDWISDFRDALTVAAD